MLSAVIKTTILSAILLVVIDGGIIHINNDGRQEHNGGLYSTSYDYNEVKEAVKELLESFMPPRSIRYDCPWPYRRIADSCVYITQHTGNWQQAREFCRIFDGDLATFRNDMKLSLMMSYMYRIGGETFWVGGSRHNSSYDFMWLDGSYLPDISSPFWNYRDEEGLNCVTLSTSRPNVYQLENANCSLSRSGPYDYYYILCSLL